MQTVTIDEMKYIISGDDMELANGIVLHNPLVSEIKEIGEFNYLYMISLITMRAYDDAVNLYDSGINYKDISDFLIFIRNMKHINKDLAKVIFTNININEFEIQVNKENGECIFTDGQFVIDELIYRQIVAYVRAINYIDEKIEFDMAEGKNNMRFFIDRMRHRLKKRMKKPPQPFLSNLISSMVCTADFPYDYTTIFEIHISQLYNGFYRKDKSDSARQIRQAIYAGTIDKKDVSNSLLMWYGDIKDNK